MRIARDFMTAKPICLDAAMELKSAMRLFLDHHITSAPVLDAKGKVLGVLTELDLVKGILRHHVELSEHAAIRDHMDLLEEAVCVDETATVTVILKSIVKATAHRVIVVDRIQRVVGIISPKDVLKLVMGETMNSPSLQDQLKAAKAKIETLSVELESLSKDREQFERVFMDSPYMMHSVDLNGRIVMANKKIHDVLGYSPGELAGKTIFDLYPQTLHKEAERGLQAIMDKGFHGLTYTTMLTKHREPVRVDIASSALLTRNGHFLSTISISRLVDSEALLRALHGVVKDMSKVPRD
jgi:PAS domain S-box-containing protein